MRTSLTTSRLNPGQTRSDTQYMHTLAVRVYYEDTDAGGVVFYANYLKFMERGRTEWLRTLGVGQQSLSQEQRRGFVVTRLDMQYKSPARLDDLLEITSRVTRLGRASLHFVQSVKRNGELLASGNIEIGCIDVDSLKPAALPKDLYLHLKVLIQE